MSETQSKRNGRSAMTQGDIDDRRLVCAVGVALHKPAEFVIFRLTQRTGDS
jgi:Bacteriophage tail sheath protein